MKWIIFTGTWRLTTKEVEEDVRAAVREVLARGEGIVTGGATGVDYFCMDEAMKLDSTAAHLKVIIPARLPSYIQDYYSNWCLEPVTKESIQNLELLLNRIKKANPEALIEMPYETITQEHYDLRHEQEVALAQAVYAFQVNDSTGTQDTINKAQKAGVPIELYKKYTVALDK